MAIVLIIAEDAALANSIGEFILATGHNPLFIRNKKEAQAKMEVIRPALAICDFSQISFDATRLQYEMEEVKTSIPMLILISRNIDSDPVCAMHTRTIHIVPKPLHNNDLLSLIAIWVQERLNDDASHHAEIGHMAKTFLSFTRHEVNTSLHAILAFSKFIIETDNVHNEDVRMFARHIETAGNRLHKYLNNIVDITQVLHLSDKRDYSCSYFNLTDFVFRLFQEECNLQNKRFLLEIKPALVNCNTSYQSDLKSLFTEIFKTILVSFNSHVPVKIAFDPDNKDRALHMSISAQALNSGQYSKEETDFLNRFNVNCNKKILSALGLYIVNLICRKYHGDFSISVDSKCQVEMQFSLEISDHHIRSESICYTNLN